ncbi:MAG: oxidoreductase [Moraxellaceae bacterium]|nr:oxidoreductase [Moraxellaceae bacterium]
MKGRVVAGILFAISVPVLAGTPAAVRDTVLATVDGSPVTEAEVREAIGMPLYRLELQAFELRQQKLHELLTQRLLAAEAARRGITVPQLLAQEMARLAALRDADAAQAGPEGSSAARIPTAAEQHVAARDSLLGMLTARHKVVQMLAPPPQPRVQDALAGGIARGSAAAPVTIVGFTDFHCPFCRMSEATMSELLEKYGERVRYVHRDYPIAKLHPQAPRAHLAARCAAQQDRFWPFHDRLFGAAADAGEQQLAAIATDAGLDATAFAGCLQDPAMATAVQDDIAAGTRLGVTGTPTYFINGHMVVGAQPLSRFVDAVEAALAEQTKALAKPATAAVRPAAGVPSR